MMTIRREDDFRAVRSNMIEDGTLQFLPIAEMEKLRVNSNKKSMLLVTDEENRTGCTYLIRSEFY